jgi:hypothetical protein
MVLQSVGVDVYRKIGLADGRLSEEPEEVTRSASLYHQVVETQTDRSALQSVNGHFAGRESVR